MRTVMYERFAKEAMQRELVTCVASTPIEQIMRRLLDHAIHAIVVIDDEGYAIGIVSQTDILLAQQQLALQGAGHLAASNIMSTEIITCGPDVTLLDAVTLMTRNHIHRLLVAKPNSERIYPLGIISMTDVIRYVIKDTASAPGPALRFQCT